MKRGPVRPSLVLKPNWVDMQRGLLKALVISNIVIGSIIYWLITYICSTERVSPGDTYLVALIVGLIPSLLFSTIWYKLRLDSKKILFMEDNTCRRYRRKPTEGLGRDHFRIDVSDLANAKRQPKIIRTFKWYYVYFEREKEK